MQRWRAFLAQVGIRTPFARDALLAGAIAVLGLVQLLFNTAAVARVVWLPAPTSAQIGFLAALIVVGAVPLAWRRRAPLAVAAVAVGSTVASAVVSGGQQEAGLAIWIALYSVGAHSTRLRAASAWVVASLTYVAALWLVPVEIPTGVEITAGQVALISQAAASLSYGVAVLLGVYMQTRRAYLAELVDRAERLERDREVRAERAVADERARIARELHDVVAHHLSGMVVQAGAAERILDRDPERVREILGEIRRDGKTTLSSMRRLIGILREDADGAAPQPGVAALAGLVEQLRGMGVDAELRTEGEAGPLPPEVDVAAYRVAQEALTNVRKHAPGAHATVTVRLRPRDVEVEVVDDGAADGADAVVDEDSGGVGLVGLRERVSLLGGELSAGPRAGGGWVVRARLPYAAAAARELGEPGALGEASDTPAALDPDHEVGGR